MKPKMVLLIISLGLILSGSAWSQDQRATPELMARLGRMADVSDWKIKTTGGGYKGQWLLHQARIRRIVDEIKAGRRVDAREIEALQKEHRDLLP